MHDYFYHNLGPVSYTHLDVYKRQVVECLQEAERSLCHLRASVVEASTQGFGYPCRVAGKDWRGINLYDLYKDGLLMMC